jgi:predicted dienelactone hydrolase
MPNNGQQHMALFTTPFSPGAAYIAATAAQTMCVPIIVFSHGKGPTKKRSPHKAWFVAQTRYQYIVYHFFALFSSGRRIFL